METTEFSLEGFTDYCKLKWSKPRLAKNLNWYRKAEPTEEFWDWYNGPDDKDKDYRKSQKEFLKKNHITLYKEYGYFGLFDWNFKERGTEKEYEEQHQKKESELIPEIYNSLLIQLQRGTAKEYELDKKELDQCKTLEDIRDFAYYKIICGVKICDSIEYKYSLI